MTTYLEATEAIYKRFQDNWGATSLFTFELEGWDPDTITLPWVRLSIRLAVSRQETKGGEGNRKFNRQGIIFGEVYTPANDGVFQVLTLAQQLQAIFVAKSFSGVWTTDSIIRDNTPDAQWARKTVETNFFFEETK